MRTITNKELPHCVYGHILIKSSVITRYRRMANALERTLNHCSEINFEYESRKNVIRENCEKEGFSTGLQLFFSQLIVMLDDYEKQQNARIEALRSLMVEAVETSFDDPDIVERIIYHIKKICCQQNIEKIIIPRTVQLPDGFDMPDYQFTDDNHITVQYDKEAIRFQRDPLCRQWLTHLETEMTTINNNINIIIPNVLNDIGWKLISLAEQKTTVQPDLSAEINR